MLKPALNARPGAGSGAADEVKTLLLLEPLSGRSATNAAARTPGSARTASAPLRRIARGCSTLSKARRRYPELRGEQVVGIEAGRRRAHASHSVRSQNAGAGEQHERERRLDHDEAAAEPRRAHAGGRSAGSRSASFKSGDADSSAGTTPKAMPVASDTIVVKASTQTSVRVASSRGTGATVPPGRRGRGPGTRRRAIPPRRR